MDHVMVHSHKIQLISSTSLVTYKRMTFIRRLILFTDMYVIFMDAEGSHILNFHSFHIAWKSEYNGHDCATRAVM